MKIQLLSLVLAPLVLTGCATMFGSSTPVSFESEPPGATYQYGYLQGKTPSTVAVTPKEAQAGFVTFRLAGYEEKTVPVDNGILGVTWLDILFWPGFIVDFATGNAYTVKSPVVSATLEPEVRPAPTQATFTMPANSTITPASSPATPHPPAAAIPTSVQPQLAH